MTNVEESQSRYDSMSTEEPYAESQGRIGREIPLKDLIALTRNKVEATSVMKAKNFKIKLRRLPLPLDIAPDTGDDGRERKKPEPIRKKPPLKKTPAETDIEKPSPPPTPDKLFSDEAVTQMYAVAQLYRDIALDLQTYNHHAGNINESFKQAFARMENIETRMMTGQLLWRIPNFGETWAKAKGLEKTVLHSPAFQTHPNGYQLSLTLCPYGDGKAQGETMSLFFCLEKNVHDALLPWPFTQRVQFALIDQSEEEEKKHVVVAFEPKPTKANLLFLQRPKKVRNPSLGMPRFVTHGNLWSGRYVVDDTIFIRVTVDLKGIPIY